MSDNLDDLGLPARANLTVETIHEVQTTAEKFPSPSFVTDAVGPEVLSGEGRKWSSSITDEATSGVGVHAEQKGNEQVVSVPESLERLLSDPVVSGGVDQQHA